MRRFVLPLLAALAFAPPTPAQVAPASPHTGDAWLDARLPDVDRYAATYRDAFADELVRYQRAPRDLVADLLARPGWTAGDAYFACALAVQLGRPCREVAEARDAPPGSDWAAVAQRLGVAPGAPAYRAVRDALTASYARWARPLPRDPAPNAEPPRKRDPAATRPPRAG